MKPDILRHAQLAPAELKRTRSLAGPSHIPLVSKTESAADWLKTEQLLYSCLVTGDDQSAASCLELLEQRFGDSNERVQSLRGVFEEGKASGRQTEDILKRYEQDIKANPANIPLAKRRIVLLRSIGKEHDAITALCELLDLSPTDTEAWAELASLYVKRSMYKQAVYCLEEAVLLQPNSWNIQARLGEVFLKASASASAGTDKQTSAEQIIRSFQHFCRSIELCDDYVRGYCGLKQASGHMLQAQQDNPGLFEEISVSAVQRLLDLAVVKLRAIIKKYPSGADAPSDVVAARFFLGEGDGTSS